MKYFTPQLYVEFNSDDANLANPADAKWEQASADYRSYVQSISAQLPPSVRELAESVCLHDASYLGSTKTPVPKSGGETATVALRQGEKVVLLFYVLAEEPTLSQAYAADVFSEQHVHWLYDEVGIATSGAFSHDILLSNGRIFAVQFVALHMLVVDEDDLGRLTSTGEAATTGI